MTHQRFAPTDSAEPVGANRRTELEAIFRQWVTKRPDAREAIQEHPDLAEQKSAVIELAYVAFRRRRAAGEAIDAGEYCRKFPEIESSLGQILEVDAFLSQNSDLAEPAQARAWPEQGDVIAGFEVVDEIGRGAFSRVYLAREPELGDRLVALKASALDVGEAEILGRLDHPHIVPIHSVYADASSDLVFLCMPYYGRATLADALHAAAGMPPRARTGGLFAAVARPSADDACQTPHGSFANDRDYTAAVLRLGAVLADALEHAHQRGILHLDLKPSNVLLASDGRPLLLDFNLSCDDRNLRRRLGGTLPYIAPEALEKITGAPSDAALNARADVFSLGVLLYQLLTLELPFKPDRRDAPLATLAEEQLARIRTGIEPTDWGWLDGRTTCLIRRCLSFEPDNRPATAAAVAAELRRCLSSPARIGRLVRRRPWSSVATTIGTLVVIIGLTVTWLTRTPEYRVLYESGQRYSTQGNYEQAIVAFNSALELEPDYAEAYLGKACALLKTGAVDESHRSFVEANRRRPTPEGLCGETFTACRLNRFTDAIAAGETYRRLYGDDAALLNNLGFALFKAGKIAEARSVLDAACNHPGAKGSCYFNRAALAVRRAQGTADEPDPQAIEDLRRAVAAAPAVGESYFQLAYLIACKKNRDAHDTAELLRLVEQSRRFGASRSLILSLRPLTPELDELNRQATTAPSGDAAAFLYERLISPY